MAKTKTKPKRAGKLLGGLERKPVVEQPRQISEAEQRTTTFKAQIDSVCSGQWAQQIIHERLDHYPPNGMRLGDAKVLTPEWNAAPDEQSNSGGVNGTRRWTPRGSFSGCRWAADGSPRFAPSMEDEHDLLEVGETRHAARWWPQAIRYGDQPTAPDGHRRRIPIYDPRKANLIEPDANERRWVKLGDWPAHAVPEEPIILRGAE